MTVIFYYRSCFQISTKHHRVYQYFSPHLVLTWNISLGITIWYNDKRILNWVNILLIYFSFICVYFMATFRLHLIEKKSELVKVLFIWWLVCCSEAGVSFKRRVQGGWKYIFILSTQIINIQGYCASTSPTDPILTSVIV